MVAQFDWVGILIAIPVGVGEVVEVGCEAIVVLVDGGVVVFDRLGVEVVVFAVVALVLAIVSGGRSPTEEAELAQGWEIQGEEHEEQSEDC